MGNQPYPCQSCCGDVLVWDKDNYSGHIELQNFMQFYRDMGLFVDSQITYGLRRDLPYRFIFWPLPKNDPVWWPKIANNEWSGRLVITVDFMGPQTSDYLNSKTPLTGITAGYEKLWASQPTVEPDELTGGLSEWSLRGWPYVVRVSGGTVLSYRKPPVEDSWAVRNKPSGSTIDWVVLGTNVPASSRGLMNVHRAFFENLWTVPL